MAISHRATGTATFSAATFSPGIPAGAVAGDMMLLIVGGKPHDGGFSASAGWNLSSPGGRYTSGTNAAGVDTGSMFITSYYKEHTGSESNPTVTEGSPVWNVVGGYIVVFSKDAAETWATPSHCGGGDTGGNTALSITTDANPGITAGDAVYTAVSLMTDAATPTASPIDWTATGITGATDTRDPSTDPETTTGGDMAFSGIRSLSITGTSSAAPSITGTLAANSEAAGVLIRLRVTAAPSGLIPDHLEIQRSGIAVSRASGW